MTYGAAERPMNVMNNAGLTVWLDGITPALR